MISSEGLVANGFWGSSPRAFLFSNRSDLGACELRLALLAFAVYPGMWLRLHVNLALGKVPQSTSGYQKLLSFKRIHFAKESYQEEGIYNK